MGIGDEIMVTGEVRKLLTTHRKMVRKVAIVDPLKHLVRWDPIWEGNPHIAAPGQTFDAVLAIGPGSRPYIKNKLAHQWVWKKYGPPKGEIFLTPEELAMADDLKGSVLIQPWSKPSASPNKKWSNAQWQQLVNDNPDVPWVQVGHTLQDVIKGVRFVFTPTFRHACGALLGARAAVLQEGGLHHAAAALGVPAVVIFGGFISPAVTGYNTQRNLFHASAEYPLGCGMRVGCPHCEAAMSSITPRDVMRELKELI